MSEIRMVTVMSYAPTDRACDGCGVKRLIYSADIHPERVVRDRCKDCLLKIAEADDKEVFVKTTWWQLRAVWEKDRRPEEPAHLRATRLAKQQNCPETATQKRQERSSAVPGPRDAPPCPAKPARAAR